MECENQKGQKSTGWRLALSLFFLGSALSCQSIPTQKSPSDLSRNPTEVKEVVYQGSPESYTTKYFAFDDFRYTTDHLTKAITRQGVSASIEKTLSQLPEELRMNYVLMN